MMLVEASGAVHSVPTHAREVFNVSGAGDTVIATLALAYAGGCRWCRQCGCRTPRQAWWLARSASPRSSRPSWCGSWRTPGTPSGEPGGLRSLAETVALVERWKRQGLSVGFTNGCFDILHAGHVALLKAARGGCDRLVVALNTDASVARLKGPERPINSLEQRAAVLAAIRHVDCVVGFADDTPLALIRRLLPDMLIKGADYQPDEVVGADVCRRREAR